MIAVTTSVDLPFGGAQYTIQIETDRAPGVRETAPASDSRARHRAELAATFAGLLGVQAVARDILEVILTRRDAGDEVWAVGDCLAGESA